MTSTVSRMTVEEFAQMRTADTEDYELVEGNLVPLSCGTPLQAMTRDRVGRLIEAWLNDIPRGAVFAEIDCRLSTYTVRRPDLSVFLGERANAFDLNCIPVPFAPDIAIEVLSPSESAIDVNRKALEYLAGGSREVWLLDHLNCEVFVQTASAIQLFRGADPVASKLLPGFAPAVNELLGNPRASRLTPAPA